MVVCFVVVGLRMPDIVSIFLAYHLFCDARSQKTEGVRSTLSAFSSKIFMGVGSGCVEVL